MSEQIDNLILEHLKAIRADMSSMNADMKEATHRLGRIEMAVAGLRRDIALTDEASAEQSLRIDRMNERIERIERRLELA